MKSTPSRVLGSCSGIAVIASPALRVGLDTAAPSSRPTRPSDVGVGPYPRASETSSANAERGLDTRARSSLAARPSDAAEEPGPSKMRSEKDAVEVLATRPSDAANEPSPSKMRSEKDAVGAVATRPSDRGETSKRSCSASDGGAARRPGAGFGDGAPIARSVVDQRKSTVMRHRPTRRHGHASSPRTVRDGRARGARPRRHPSGSTRSGEGPRMHEQREPA